MIEYILVYSCVHGDKDCSRDGGEAEEEDEVDTDQSVNDAEYAFSTHNIV